MEPMAHPRPTRSTRGAPGGRARLLAAAGLIALLGGMGVIVITTGGAQDSQSLAPAAATEPQPWRRHPLRRGPLPSGLR